MDGLTSPDLCCNDRQGSQIKQILILDVLYLPQIYGYLLTLTVLYADSADNKMKKVFLIFIRK